jgi:dolichol-phosphate mannosyltransferase
LSVVVPTRNERDNAGALIERLDDALRGIDAEVVFVDDSDDDTPDVITAARSRAAVRVLHREDESRKGGLSTAVVEGIREAAGDYICVIDGDLQHPPEKIPELLAKAEETGADVVLASRRRTKDGAAGLANPLRKGISLSLEWFTRLAFYDRLRGLDDPLSGFFLVRRTALEGVELRPEGYKISLEILVRCHDTRVEQIPYTFEARPAGESKADLKTGLTFFKHLIVLLIEVPEARRFWKFAAVGASGLGIYLLLLWLLVLQAGLPQFAGWAIAAESAVLWNFFNNRNITWSERRSSGGGALLWEALRYHASSAFSVGANALVLYLLTLAGVNLLVAGFCSVWAGVITNFLAADRFVFVRRGRRAASPEPAAAPLDTARAESLPIEERV